MLIPTQTQGPKKGMGLSLDLDMLAHEQPLLRENQTWEVCTDFPTTILRAHQNINIYINICQIFFTKKLSLKKERNFIKKKKKLFKPGTVLGPGSINDELDEHKPSLLITSGPNRDRKSTQPHTPYVTIPMSQGLSKTIRLTME